MAYHLCKCDLERQSNCVWYTPLLEFTINAGCSSLVSWVRCHRGRQFSTKESFSNSKHPPRFNCDNATDKASTSPMRSAKHWCQQIYVQEKDHYKRQHRKFSPSNVPTTNPMYKDYYCCPIFVRPRIPVERDSQSKKSQQIEVKSRLKMNAVARILPKVGTNEHRRHSIRLRSFQHAVLAYCTGVKFESFPCSDFQVFFRCYNNYK